MTDPTPIRLRLSRTKGFDLQLLSRTTNGLPAKSVARPLMFGNPFRVVQAGRDIETGQPVWAARHDYEINYGFHPSREEAAAHAVVRFRECLETGMVLGAHARTMRCDVIRHELRGHNLACWCPLPEPGQPDHCHAAVLLEVANG
jgi:hypothetical protein